MGNNRVFKYVLFLILISINGISLEMYHINKCGQNFIDDRFEEKFKISKFKGKVCRNVAMENIKISDLAKIDILDDYSTYNENDIKIISNFDLINKTKSSEIKKK